MGKATKLKNTYAAKQFMKSFNNQLEDLQERVYKLADKIGKETVERVQDYIRIYYYEAYPEGDNYERLGMNGGFMGAIRYEVEDTGWSVYINIIFDASKLVFGHTGSKMLPSHVDLDSGAKHFTTGLYNYMMYGEWPSNKGRNTVAPDFTGLDDGGKLSEYISSWLNEYVSDRLREAMAQSGLFLSNTAWVQNRS